MGSNFHVDLGAADVTGAAGTVGAAELLFFAGSALLSTVAPTCFIVQGIEPRCVTYSSKTEIM